jgi:hypothetical protein
VAGLRGLCAITGTLVIDEDGCYGYITWDQFLANRQRLAGNRTNCEVLTGPAREGLCLLQGLLVCGICGRRLGVRYTGNGGLYPIYQCNWRHREALSRKACMSVASKPLDDAIAERLVTAITPMTIELALEALTSLEERDKAIAAQWRRRSRHSAASRSASGVQATTAPPNRPSLALSRVHSA